MHEIRRLPNQHHFGQGVQIKKRRVGMVGLVYLGHRQFACRLIVHALISDSVLAQSPSSKPEDCREKASPRCARFGLFPAILRFGVGALGQHLIQYQVMYTALEK